MGFIVLEKGIFLETFKALQTRHYFRLLETKLIQGLVQHRCPKVA